MVADETATTESSCGQSHGQFCFNNSVGHVAERDRPLLEIPEADRSSRLPTEDPNMLFSLLDDGDAELTAVSCLSYLWRVTTASTLTLAVKYQTAMPAFPEEELVKGVERLKGTAKGIDLAAFIAEYRNCDASSRALTEDAGASHARNKVPVDKSCP